MKWHIRKCPKCNTYTMKQNCPKCGSETLTPHPAKFSPHDKYSKLREPPV
ncbi:MAG TPA: RNA-protein complex protein Nop10 [archaeon]|nr:RNA-protein complex protein Nop10 [archaeon]